MGANTACVADAQVQPASISGACSMMFHQVDMSSEDLLKYSDARGSYSIITRRFTEITTGYQNAQANARQTLNTNQPIGTVTSWL